MIPTYFGVIVLFLGIWLMRRGTPLMLVCAMLAFGLFEASAAIILPVLSYSSIPPARMMLAFVLISALMQVRERASLLREAVIANAALLIFCAYGLIGALLLPRIFAGEISVVPMRPTGIRNLFDTFPLAFSAQNITTGFYLTGSGLTALAAYIAGRLTDDSSIVVKTGIFIAVAHATVGILGVALAGTFWDQVVDVIRNGSYSQLNQIASGFGRINGFMSEPSAFARFGFVWMVFTAELWLRDASRRAGPAALLMATALAASLSSTAYVALAAYGAILAVRFACYPKYAQNGKAATLVIVGLTGTIFVLAVIAAAESFSQQIGGLLERMTVQKSGSSSGQQRLFWAMQGFDAFRVSWGLGIGPGSFRSSSLATSILGSSGVVGVTTFVLYLVRVFALPARPASGGETALRHDVAAAAAWTVGVSMIPAMLIQGSPDPGMEFAALAGLSLALRRPALAAEQFRRQGGGWGSAPATSPPPTAPATPQPGGWRRHSS